MNVIECSQGSREWLDARLGRVTASRVGDVIGKTKSGWAAARGSYMNELLTERLTRAPVKVFRNEAMLWGSEQEATAFGAYEVHTSTWATRIGFVLHPTIEMAGASPDGLVGDDGLVEIKCPSTISHVECLTAQVVPAKHIPQIQFQLACTGRQWCDFVSFDPRVPEGMQIFCIREPRNERVIEDIDNMVKKFLDELKSKEDLLDKYRNIAQVSAVDV